MGTLAALTQTLAAPETAFILPMVFFCSVQSLQSVLSVS